MIDIARWNKTFLAHYREAGKAYNDAFNYGVSVLGAEEPTAPHYAVMVSATIEFTTPAPRMPAIIMSTAMSWTSRVTG